MYEILHGLLSDKKGGEIFTLFGLWHFIYVFLALAVIFAVLFFTGKKERAAKEKAAKALGSAAFFLYIADLFLMPIAYGEIDIEKLPFHICTAMCVMCFLSERVPALKKMRMHFILLGFISNLVYLIYPAGVMWHAVHPLCYRVVQTLLFHGVMTAYGFLSILFSADQLTLKTWYKDLLTTVLMTVWALFGNFLYNGSADGYDHFFNWFFVVRDPFNALNANLAPYVMPYVNVALFFAVQMLILGVFTALRSIKNKKTANGLK